MSNHLYSDSQKADAAAAAERRLFFFKLPLKEATLQNRFRCINLLLPSAAGSPSALFYASHYFQLGFHEWVPSLITFTVKLQPWTCARRSPSEGWQRGAGIFMAPDINHRDAEPECLRKEDLKQRPECNFVCLTGGVCYLSACIFT